MPATTPVKRRRLAAILDAFWILDSGYWLLDGSCSVVIGPKRSELRQNSGTRAHGENIADDSADSGGGALERFDRARMIVALDLEGDGPAVTDIDHAGVFFARFDQDIRSGGRKFFEFLSGILVGAVLAPHNREDAELGEIWFPSEDFLDALEFFRASAHVSRRGLE